MGSEANVVRLPVGEQITCHLTVPRFGDTIAEEDDTPSGLSALGTQMEFVAEQFHSLAKIFFDCPEATYSPKTFFVNGQLTFVFQVPRRFVSRLRELGWSADDLDVEAEGTVTRESETSDA